MAFKMKAGKEGPMKKNFPSAFQAKRKFTADVRDKRFVGESKGVLDEDYYGRTAVDDKIDDARRKAAADKRSGVSDATLSRQATEFMKSDANVGARAGSSASDRTFDDLITKTSNVKVKVKGRKDKSTGKGTDDIRLGVDSQTAKKGGELKDVKKVVMKTGSGKGKVKTKVKYNKDGTIKKVVTRRGRFGLRKTDTAKTGVRVGTESGKDVTGAKAAERVVQKTSQANIVGTNKRDADEDTPKKNYMKGYAKPGSKKRKKK